MGEFIIIGLYLFDYKITSQHWKNSQILDNQVLLFTAGNKKPENHSLLSTTKTYTSINHGHFISSSLALESWL